MEGLAASLESQLSNELPQRQLGSHGYYHSHTHVQTLYVIAELSSDITSLVLGLSQVTRLIEPRGHGQRPDSAHA